MRIHHFYPSVVVECDVNNNYSLKVGTSPTVLLTPFSKNNEYFREDSKIARLVGSAKDLQHVHDCQRNNEKTVTDKNA